MAGGDSSESSDNQIIITQAAAPVFTPPSLQDMIGYYNEGPRSDEWFERLTSTLTYHDYPVCAIVPIVKQLLPSEHRNKVDLAKDESKTMVEFVAALKRRLQRQKNLLKRSRTSIQQRRRRHDEPVEDFVLLVKSDLRSAFPDLTDTTLSILAQYECWKQLPEEIAARAPLNEKDSLQSWSAKVDQLYELPPSAVAQELNNQGDKLQVSKIDYRQNSDFTKLEQSIQKQAKDMNDLKQQIEKLSMLQMNKEVQYPNQANDLNVRCYCNTPAVCQYMRKQGRNQNRPFLCCPAPRETKCQFFKWVDSPPTSNQQSWGSSGNNDGYYQQRDNTQQNWRTNQPQPNWNVSQPQRNWNVGQQQQNWNANQHSEN